MDHGGTGRAGGSLGADPANRLYAMQSPTPSGYVMGHRISTPEGTFPDEGHAFPFRGGESASHPTFLVGPAMLHVRDPSAQPHHLHTNHHHHERVSNFMEDQRGHPHHPHQHHPGQQQAHQQAAGVPSSRSDVGAVPGGAAGWDRSLSRIGAAPPPVVAGRGKRAKPGGAKHSRPAIATPRDRGRFVDGRAPLQQYQKDVLRGEGPGQPPPPPLRRFQFSRESGNVVGPSYHPQRQEGGGASQAPTGVEGDDDEEEVVQVRVREDHPSNTSSGPSSRPAPYSHSDSSLSNVVDMDAAEELLLRRFAGMPGSEADADAWSSGVELFSTRQQLEDFVRNPSEVLPHQHLTRVIFDNTKDVPQRNRYWMVSANEEVSRSCALKFEVGTARASPSEIMDEAMYQTRTYKLKVGCFPSHLQLGFAQLSLVLANTLEPVHLSTSTPNGIMFKSEQNPVPLGTMEDSRTQEQSPQRNPSDSPPSPSSVDSSDGHEQRWISGIFRFQFGVHSTNYCRLCYGSVDSRFRPLFRLRVDFFPATGHESADGTPSARCYSPSFRVLSRVPESDVNAHVYKTKKIKKKKLQGDGEPMLEIKAGKAPDSDVNWDMPGPVSLDREDKMLHLFMISPKFLNRQDRLKVGFDWLLRMSELDVEEQGCLFVMMQHMMPHLFRDLRPPWNSGDTVPEEAPMIGDDGLRGPQFHPPPETGAHGQEQGLVQQQQQHPQGEGNVGGEGRTAVSNVWGNQFHLNGGTHAAWGAAHVPRSFSGVEGDRRDAGDGGGGHLAGTGKRPAAIVDYLEDPLLGDVSSGRGQGAGSSSVPADSSGYPPAGKRPRLGFHGLEPVSEGSGRRDLGDEDPLLGGPTGPRPSFLPGRGLGESSPTPFAAQDVASRRVPLPLQQQQQQCLSHNNINSSSSSSNSNSSSSNNNPRPFQDERGGAEGLIGEGRDPRMEGGEDSPTLFVLNGGEVHVPASRQSLLSDEGQSGGSGGADSPHVGGGAAEVQFGSPRRTRAGRRYNNKGG